MKLYHVVANIDSIFPTLQEAVEKYNNLEPVKPYIPVTAAPGEDKTIPRIPVCETITGCFTSIGLLGRFRRTLSACEDAKSYANAGKEVYPIIIIEFEVDERDVYTPTLLQVPDAEYTGEKWLLETTMPKNVCAAWLNMYSVVWDGYQVFNNHAVYRCKSITFTPWDELPKMNHPWLNGKGHVLESSEEECDP